MSSWLEDLVERSLHDPTGRVVAVECDELEIDGELVGRVLLTFTVEDVRGQVYEARGRLLVPQLLRAEPATALPLVFHCGYEAPESLGAKQVARGRISATTVQLPPDAVFPNSYCILRGPKMEFVLGHLLRSVSFVDPGKVVYAGGSAGGYAALLAAAETFPAAAAVPAVPPVNLAYMSAVSAANLTRLAGTDASSVEWLTAMGAVVAAWAAVHGDDYDAPSWLEHSPVGHIDRICCPVATFFSTVDILVPMPQVDQALAAAVVEARPGGLELRPAELTEAASVQVRLLDVLADRADVTVVPVPDGYAPMLQADLAMVTEMPPFTLAEAEPQAGTWAITVVDEGEPVFLVSHFKHQLEPDFEPFVSQALRTPTQIGQLTPAKLQQLLARWTGEEWFSPAFSYLDRPEAERADVELGLRSYCTTSPAHAERFRDLYSALPAERQALPADLVAELSSGESMRSPLS